VEGTGLKDLPEGFKFAVQGADTELSFLDHVQANQKFLVLTDPVNAKQGQKLRVKRLSELHV